MKRRMVLGVILILLALLCLAVSAAAAQDPEVQGAAPQAPQAPPQACSFLTNTLTHNHFVIYYNVTNTRKVTQSDWVTLDMVREVATILEDGWWFYTTDPNFSFRWPAGTGTASNPQRLSVCLLDLEDLCGIGGWCGGHPCDYLAYDSVCIRNKYNNAANRHLKLGELVLHELFHRVQYSYDREGECPTAGGQDCDVWWTIEGSANTIQDKVFGGLNSLDAWPDSFYVNRVNAYLANPLASLLDLAKEATLFWTYYMQRCGAVRDEPELGMDAMRIFWEQALNYDGVEAMDAAIRLAPGCPDLNSMEDLFHDFTVANYVKLLGNVSERYQYVDEQDFYGTLYDDVHIRHGREVISATGPMQHNMGGGLPWSVNYFVGLPDADCDWVQVELDGEPGNRALYTVLTVEGGNAYHYDSPLFRHKGEDFVRTVYADGVDEVVAIVGTAHRNNIVRAYMRCVEPTLQIEVPREGRFVVAGDPADPRRFIIAVSVTDDGAYVGGLEPEDFTVRVGGETAVIQSGSYVQNHYWLVVEPPTKSLSIPEPWAYDLEVSLSNLSDSVSNGVHYAPHTNYDEVLVIDVSASMELPAESPKLQAAKNAARLFLDEMHEDDRMGAVTFDTEANPVWQGVRTLTGEFRLYARGMIQGLGAGGCTSVGGGLELALQTFSDGTYPGLPENPDAIILLSDGQENTSPCWKSHGPSACPSPPFHDCSTGPYVQTQIVDSGIPVHTIALGPGAHEALMDEISTATGGEPLFVPFSASLAASAQKSGVATGPQQVDNWQLGISDAYDYLGGRVRGRTRIHSEQVTAPDTGTYFRSMTLDDTIVHATFAVAHDTPYSSLQHKVTLLPPVGKPIVPAELPSGASYRSDDHHNVYEIPNPEPGEWQVRVDYYDTAGKPDGPYEFVIMVSGESQTSLEVMIGAPTADRLTGTGIPIFVAFLGPNGLLPGATLAANVVGPDRTYPLSLRDDGQHGDGEADDGFYGAIFAQTTISGNHTVLIDGQAGDATRQARASFHVEADADDDGDGMPNGWEERYGLDPNQDDALGDPDRDYLSNKNEFLYGTHPMLSDTDGGGESDGSEADVSDPVNDPDDDLIDTPTDFRAVAGNGRVTIYYNQPAASHQIQAEDWDYLILTWSTDPNMADPNRNTIMIDPTGVYSHTGLTNGTTYYYVLQAMAPNPYGPGNLISGFTDQVSATPKSDPYPPRGMVVIDADAPVARSWDAALTIEAVDDSADEESPAGPKLNPPADMRVANDLEFTGASWEPYATTREWRLSGNPGERTCVYLQFRDAAQNVSPVVNDCIWLPRRLYLPMILRSQP